MTCAGCLARAMHVALKEDRFACLSVGRQHGSITMPGYANVSSIFVAKRNVMKHFRRQVILLELSVSYIWLRFLA